MTVLLLLSASAYGALQPAEMLSNESGILGSSQDIQPLYQCIQLASEKAGALS